MAIYHCSVKVFSRNKGHSAVAAAAYRSGSKLKDERTGIIHHYSNRHGVVDDFIVLPTGADKAYLNRSSLWNAVEKAEKRKDARTARELNLSLPHELSPEANKALTEDMANWLVERYGVIVDAAIHEPVIENGDDHRNVHAHILFTTRAVTSDGLGMKTRILDEPSTGVKEIHMIREVWETLINDALIKAGFDDCVVDRRTLEEQEIDRIPEVPEGRHTSKSHQEEETSEDDQTDEDTDSDTDTEGKSGKGDSLPPSMDVEEDTIETSSQERSLEPPKWIVAGVLIL